MLKVSSRALQAACSYLERHGAAAKGSDACLAVLYRSGSYDLRRDVREIRRLLADDDVAARRSGIARCLAHARLVDGTPKRRHPSSSLSNRSRGAAP